MTREAIVVEKVVVDVAQMSCAHQITQALIVTRGVAARAKAIVEGESVAHLTAKLHHRLGAGNALYPIVQSIDRTVGRHTVLGVELRPIDLRISLVAAAPRIADGSGHV